MYKALSVHSTHLYLLWERIFELSFRCVDLGYCPNSVNCSNESDYLGYRPKALQQSYHYYLHLNAQSLLYPGLRMTVLTHAAPQPLMWLSFLLLWGLDNYLLIPAVCKMPVNHLEMMIRPSFLRGDTSATSRVSPVLMFFVPLIYFLSTVYTVLAHQLFTL